MFLSKINNMIRVLESHFSKMWNIYLSPYPISVLTPANWEQHFEDSLIVNNKVLQQTCTLNVAFHSTFCMYMYNTVTQWLKTLHASMHNILQSIEKQCQLLASHIHVHVGTSCKPSQHADLYTKLLLHLQLSISIGSFYSQPSSMISPTQLPGYNPCYFHTSSITLFKHRLHCFVHLPNAVQNFH